MNPKLRLLRSLLPATAVMGGTLFGVGCTEEAPPIKPAELSSSSALRARTVLASTSKAVVFMEDDNGTLMRTMSRVSSPPIAVRSQPTVRVMAEAVPPMRPFFKHAEQKPTLAGKLVAATIAESESETMGKQLDEAAADLEALLKDRILTDSQIETKGDAEVVYLLKPEVACVPLPSSGVTEIDAECVMDLQRLPVRVAMTRDGDGARLRFLVGEEKVELVAFIVHDQALALEVDLASFRRGAEIVNAKLGEDSGDFDGLNDLRGKLKLSLAREGEAKFRFGYHVLEDVVVDVADEMGNPAALVRMAKRPGPTFLVVADATTKTASFALDVGQTEVSTTWDPQSTGAANRDLKVVLGGITGAIDVRDAQETVTLKGVGLGGGPTYVDVRGNRIFQLDLNPNDGRKLDWTIALGEGDKSTMSLSKLDLSLAFKLGLIASDLKEPPAEELRDETYSIRFAGASPVQFTTLPDDPATGTGGGVKVLAGTLEIGSTRTSTKVTVAPNMCLVEDAVQPGEHPVIGALASATCQ